MLSLTRSSSLATAHGAARRCSSPSTGGTQPAQPPALRRLSARYNAQFTPPEQVLFLPQVLEKALPFPAPQAWKELPPGLTVFEPLKTVLIEFGKALQLSVMNAFGLPPVLSFLIRNWLELGVTVIAVFE